MSKYIEMSDKQINREVAEHLGWTVQEMVVRPDGGRGYASADWSKYPDMPTWKRVWHLDEPRGGDPYYRYEPGRDFESAFEAWQHLVDHLDYATDNNASAALDFGDARIIIDIFRGMARIIVNSDAETMECQDAIESRARTIAWLMYRDAIDKR